MGNPWRRSLLILAFLSVAFITFSLAGASSGDGRVFVCVQPAEDVYTYYYIQYGDSVISLDTLQSDFRCGYVPRSFVGKRLFVVVDSYGLPRKIDFPARLHIYDHNGTGAVVLTYYENEHNVVHLSATSFGVGYLRLDVNVPKSVAPFDHILGPAVICDTDPLLRIYLRAEKGAVDVSGIKITGVSGENALDEIKTSLDFAACDLRVSHFKTSVADGQLLASFQILDGNTPVYIKDVSVLVGNTLIRPQFSTRSMRYSFTISGVSPPLTVNVSAPVHGCGTLSFETTVQNVGGHSSYGFVVLVLALIVFGAAFYLARR